MRKNLTGIFFTLLLLSSSSYDQLFKFPILIAHFIEHQQRDPRVDFMDFLSMHYFGEDIDDNDNDRDMQLPFKTVDQTNSHIVSMPVVSICFDRQAIELEGQDSPVVSENNTSDPSLSSLFRPPRA